MEWLFTRLKNGQKKAVVSDGGGVGQQSGGELKSPLPKGEEDLRLGSSYCPNTDAESAEAFREVFNSTYDSILLHTPEGVVFDANDTFLRMYGVSRANVSRITIEAISSPSMSMHAARDIWARVLAGEPQLFEWKARRLDNGAEFDVEVFLRRIRFNGQDVILANVRDLTLRKQIEEELREQRDLAHLRADATLALQGQAELGPLLNSLAGLVVERFDAAFARVWTLDASGQVLELQASAGMYTHLDGRHSRVRVGELKIGRIALQRRSIVANQVVGDPQIAEQEWARRERLVAFAGVPLISEGRLLGVMALFARHVLSPAAVETFEAIGGALAQALGRKKAEAALEAARQDLARANAELEAKVQERTAKLQETIAELEHFSYTITHDMRAPLRAMQGLGGFLVSECEKCDEPARKEYIRRIAKAAERMDKLITDALQYGKTLHDPFGLEPVDVDALLHGILESYPNFEPLNRSIDMSGHLPMLLGNQAALTQCFSNLISNAIKFAKPGEKPHLRVWAEPRGKFWRLWFEDKGIGIPKRYQDRIWTMFQKLDRDTEGTGIGLALVRKVVKRMGGEVGVESELGQGSRFWIELKAAQGAVERAATPQT